MVTSVDIVNRALTEIASQSQIVTLEDGTPEAVAASALYASTVAMMLRTADPEFARRTVAAAMVQAVAPSPWSITYQYPADCVRLRQLVPAQYAPNDPQPVRWSVQADPATGTVKLILTNQAIGDLVYTSSAVTENQWDAIFTEGVVRMLASEMVMPIGGRPDFSKQKLAEAGGIFDSAGQRDS